MPLKGSLRDFSLPDLFQLIHFGKKNGTLNITNGDAKGYVCFRNGNVFFATHNWKRPPLGRRLTESGMVSEEQIDEALDLQKTTRKGQRLGNILVEMGYLSRESLEVFVEEQIRDAVFHLLRWTEGEFDFDPNQIFPEEDIGLSMTTEDLIMEGSRRLDEWYQIEKKVPSLDSVFKMTKIPGKDATDINLTSEEWLVLYHVDGSSGVRDIIEKSGQSALVTCKALYGLVTAGLVVLTEEEARAADTVPGVLEEEIEKMEEEEPAGAPDASEAPLEPVDATVAEPAEAEPAGAEAPVGRDAAAAPEPEVEEARAPKSRRKSTTGRKKPVEEITLGEADEEVLVEEVTGDEVDLDDGGRKRKKSRRKTRKSIHTSAARKERLDEEASTEAEEKREPADEPEPEVREEESLIIHDQDLEPEVRAKEEEPAPGQSLVDYYKSLALKEASDNDRLLAFKETEDKKKVEFVQERESEASLDGAAEETLEEAAGYEEPEDIPLEWAGHLTRLRGGGRRLSHKGAADHPDEEEAPPGEREVQESGEEPAVAEAVARETGRLEAEPGTEEEVAAEDSFVLEELSPVVAEEADARDEATAESVRFDLEPEAAEADGGYEGEREASVSEEAATVGLDDVPPAAANYVTMEQEVEAQAYAGEPAVDEDAGSPKDIALSGLEEMEPQGSEAGLEQVPDAEEIPLLDDSGDPGRIPTEEEIEQLLQVTPKTRDLSREELLAFDQPTYPIVEPQEAHLEDEPAGAQDSASRVIQFKSGPDALQEVDLEEGTPVVELGETEEVVTAEDIAIDTGSEMEAEPPAAEVARAEPEPVEQVAEPEPVEQTVESEPESVGSLDAGETAFGGEEAEVFQLEDAAVARDEGVPPLAIEESEELEISATDVEEAEVIPIDERRQPAAFEGEEPVEAALETEDADGEEAVQSAGEPARFEEMEEIDTIEELAREPAELRVEEDEPTAGIELPEEAGEEVVFGETAEAQVEEESIGADAGAVVLDDGPAAFTVEAPDEAETVTFKAEPVSEEPGQVALEDAPAPQEKPAAAFLDPEITPAADKQAADSYFDEMDTLREITGGKTAKEEKLREPEEPAAPRREPVFEDDFAISSRPGVEEETVLAEEESEAGAEASSEDEEDFGLQVRGKRGAGTSLVDLETFELEQELLELAGGVKEKRRHITEKDREATRAKGAKDKKGRARRSKEVDKGSVKKIIDDLKKL